MQKPIKKDDDECNCGRPLKPTDPRRRNVVIKKKIKKN